MTHQRMAVLEIAKAIEKLTGYRPPTCPWYAMTDPLVGPVIEAARLAEKGLGAWALDEDPPAVVLDAMSVYLTARESVRAHDEAEDHKQRLAELKRKK